MQARSVLSRWLVAVSAVAVLVLLAPAAALATTSPTYVSGTGTATTDCTESDPCASIDEALAQTSSGGTIYVSGTVTESSAATVDQDVTIEALPDSTAELQGSSDSDGLLTIGDYTVTITGLSFTDGDNSASIGGGAINNNEGGTLTVTDSTFTGNTAANDGGAIDNGDNSGIGTVTVSDSTFSGNSATHDGGAIDNGDNIGSGTLTVTDSTFTGNTGFDGGAIDNGDDSGIGTLTVTDSTFSGDTAADHGDEIDNAAFSGSGTVNVAADVFDGGCDQNSGTWGDYGFNAATSSSCLGTPPVGQPDATAGSAAGDLGSLAANGGPTATIALLAGNPAINLIPSSTSFTVPAGASSVTVACPVTDQRGVTSPAGGACDAGAVQLMQGDVYVAGTGGVDFGKAADSNDCSVESTPCATLAGALAQTSSGGTVYVSGTVTESSAATVDQDVTIEALPGWTAELEGSSDSDGLLRIGDVTVTITGLSFTDGDNTTTAGGGAIANNDGGTLTVTDSTFSGNSATHDGGAIDNADGNGSRGTLTVTDSTFTGNTGADGGAIDNADNGGTGNLTVTDSTFTGNTATY